MSTLNVTNITNGTDTATTDKMINGSASAWAQFSGTSNAVNASYNVSSITDNGTGDYTINFTSSMADASYSAIFSSTYGSTTRESVRQLYDVNPAYVRVLTGYSYTSPGAADVGLGCIVVFR